MIVALAIYIITAIILQLWLGCIEVSIFAFPVNIAIAIATIMALWVAEKEYSSTKWHKQLRSATTSCLILTAIIIWCIIGGCISQDASSNGMAGALGLTSFPTSIPFVALLAALLVNLSMTIIRRICKHGLSKSKTFVLTHFGIWLALLSGFAGAADTYKLRTILEPDSETTKAIDNKGHEYSLPFTLKMRDFNIVTDRNGAPAQYSATIDINNNQHSISVNSPVRIGLDEKIYLVSYGNTDNGSYYAVLEDVHQPWDIPLLIGIVTMLCGTFIYAATRSKRGSVDKQKMHQII